MFVATKMVYNYDYVLFLLVKSQLLFKRKTPLPVLKLKFTKFVFNLFIGNIDKLTLGSFFLLTYSKIAGSHR